jgi:glycosyltransferase involved in cell wall biosynthesis
MRVLYLTVGSEIGGGSVSLYTLMDTLRGHGVSSTVICPAEGRLIGKYAEINVPCRVMRYNWLDRRQPWTAAKQFYQWRRTIKAIAPDVVHVNALGAVRSVGLPAWSSDIPLVCHCRYPESRDYILWLFRRLPKPDVFVSCSRGLHALISDHLAEACPNARQEVVYDAVDLDRFQPRARPDDGVQRVGIIANLTPVKGHEVFLHMARILVDRGNAPEFWLVGRDKDCGDQVRSLVESLRLAKHVKFMGYQSDIPKIMANLDVIVSSSHMECCPVNVIEAMACGRPVVVTRVGGSPELVEEGITGMIVPPKDPLDLADAVEYLLKNDKLRAAMGQAGRARAERLFRREIYAQSMLDLYQWVRDRN